MGYAAVHPTIGGPGYKPQRVQLGAWRYPLGFVTLLGGATLGIFLSTLASYVIVRVRNTSSAILETLAFTSFAFPGLIIGIGFMWAFVRTDLYATIWALLIGYVATYLPFGIRPLTSTFIQIGKDLEEASFISGAGFWRTFRRVVAPLAMPGIISGWTLIIITNMVTRRGTTVTPQ